MGLVDDNWTCGNVVSYRLSIIIFTIRIVYSNGD